MPDKRQLPCVVSKWEKYSGGPAGSECGNLIAYDITGAMATIGAKETNCHTPLRARAPGQSEASTTTAIMANTAVRRLTPRECERLQGFPDDYTLIRYRGKPAADGPRCRALGNSMAVPVMRWIGERIAAIKSY
jgi:site-specific DNA-cytosine methylase